MKRREFNKALFATGSTLAMSATSTQLFSKELSKTPANQGTYKKGEKISSNVFVLDKHMRRQSLVSILAAKTDTRVNVLYLFGGGAMGKERPGGIWCQDSYEDLHILRTLTAKYKNESVSFIPIACAPVYITQKLGFPKRVFLDQAEDAEVYKKAALAFIETTQAALDNKIIPQQPYFDLRMRLMMNKAPDKMPAGNYGEVHDWQGRFRANEETQLFGVPSFWLLDKTGLVLNGPFRGNIYYTGHNPIQINYTLADINRAITNFL